MYTFSLRKIERKMKMNYEDAKSKGGVPAIWVGGKRHCGNYPTLVAGMPGLYIYDAKEYGSMFYPAAWRYRYGVYAAEQNVTVEASPVAEGRVTAVCFPEEA